jgi:8-oxo-dGTP pyrophosphatase MutT (NUDIX family)
MPAVVFVLLNERGEALMEQRPEGDSFMPNRLVYPGGKFEPGETDPEQVLQREVREELGVTLVSYYALPGDPVSWPLRGGPKRRVYPYLVTAWDPWDLPPSVLDTGHRSTSCAGTRTWRT